MAETFRPSKLRHALYWVICCALAVGGSTACSVRSVGAQDFDNEFLEFDSASVPSPQQLLDHLNRLRGVNLQMGDEGPNGLPGDKAFQEWVANELLPSLDEEQQAQLQEVARKMMNRRMGSATSPMEEDNGSARDNSQMSAIEALREELRQNPELESSLREQLQNRPQNGPLSNLLRRPGTNERGQTNPRDSQPPGELDGPGGTQRNGSAGNQGSRSDSSESLPGNREAGRGGTNRNDGTPRGGTNRGNGAGGQEHRQTPNSLNRDIDRTTSPDSNRGDQNDSQTPSNRTNDFSNAPPSTSPNGQSRGTRGNGRREPNRIGGQESPPSRAPENGNAANEEPRGSQDPSAASPNRTGGDDSRVTNPNESFRDRFNRILLDAAQDSTDAEGDGEGDDESSGGVTGLLNKVAARFQESMRDPDRRKKFQESFERQRQSNSTPSVSSRGVLSRGTDVFSSTNGSGLLGMILLVGALTFVVVMFFSTPIRDRVFGAVSQYAANFKQDKAFQVPDINSSDELVLAIDRFVFWRFGLGAHWWHGGFVHEQLVEAHPHRAVEIDHLLDSYETARYSPTSRSLDEQRFAAATRTLQHLKDEAIAQLAEAGHKESHALVNRGSWATSSEPSG